MILLLVLERLTLCGCLLGLCHCSYALTANMHRGMMSCARGQYLGSEAHVLAHRLAHAHGTLLLSASFLAAATLDWQLSRASSVSGLISTDAMYCG